jgi:DNA end-binding protein Ku
MLDLAKHIVTQKTGEFEPEKFEDRYEGALTELINAKRQGKTISHKPRPTGGNVVDLMDALKQSLATAGSAKGKAPLPTDRKRRVEKKTAKPTRSSGRRKAG